jgi:hypothetical protein
MNNLDDWLKSVGYTGSKHGGIVSLYPEDVERLRSIPSNTPPIPNQTMALFLRRISTRIDMARSCVRMSNYAAADRQMSEVDMEIGHAIGDLETRHAP